MKKNEYSDEVLERWNESNSVLLSELSKIGFNQEDKEYIIDLLDCNPFYSIDDPKLSKLLYNSNDFIYWKRPGLITLDVYPQTVHQTCLEILYTLEIAAKEGINDFFEAESSAKNNIPKNFVPYGYLAEKFVDDCFGFYKSSQRRHLTKSDDYKMNFREKQIFKKYC